MSDQETSRGGEQHEGGAGNAHAGNAHAGNDGATGQGARKSRREPGEGFNMDAWWEDRSLAQKIFFGIGFGILGIGFIAALGWVVLILWNWLMPEIFGLKRLSYWQAWGLLVMCWILFKGIRLGSDNGSKSTDRKRRRQLRSYMTEGDAASKDAPTDSQGAGA